MSIFGEFLSTFNPQSDGWVFMWVLLVLGLGGIVLAVMKWFHFRTMTRVHPERFLLRLKKLLSEGKAEEAERISLMDKRGSLAKVAATLLQARRTHAIPAQRELEAIVLSETARAERKVSYFHTLSNISTLIGLLGTIYGLILAFAAVGKIGVSASAKTAMLAEGISTAMNTTLLGLIIAVPAMMVYSWFRHRTDSLMDEMDRIGAALFGRLFGHEPGGRGYRASAGRRAKARVEEDLNLVPVMGLMVVLIPLLLSSAQFVRLGVIEMNLPQGSKGLGDSSADDRKPVMLGLGLVVDSDSIRIRSNLPVDTLTEPMPAVPLTGEDYDYEQLTRRLAEIKKQALKTILTTADSLHAPSEDLYRLSKDVEGIDSNGSRTFPDIDNIKIVASDEIQFQRIISIMDAARDIEENGRTIPLFPLVSMGVGI